MSCFVAEEEWYDAAESGSVVSAFSADLRSHAVRCSSCGGVPLRVLDTAVSTLGFVGVADIELLDTAGPDSTLFCCGG